MEVKELKNMVYLLDDSDERVVSHIEEKNFFIWIKFYPFPRITMAQ